MPKRKHTLIHLVANHSSKPRTTSGAFCAHFFARSETGRGQAQRGGEATRCLRARRQATPKNALRKEAGGEADGLPVRDNMPGNRISGCSDAGVSERQLGEARQTDRQANWCSPSPRQPHRSNVPTAAKRRANGIGPAQTYGVEAARQAAPLPHSKPAAPGVLAKAAALGQHANHIRPACPAAFNQARLARTPVNPPACGPAASAVLARAAALAQWSQGGLTRRGFRRLYARRAKCGAGCLWKRQAPGRRP